MTLALVDRQSVRGAVFFRVLLAVAELAAYFVSIWDAGVSRRVSRGAFETGRLFANFCRRGFHS